MKRLKRNSQHGNPWEPIDQETAKAYQAFAAYRDLPADERSLSAASQQLGKTKSLCARGSAQFRWVDRAMAWDTHQDQLKRKRRAAEREKINERQKQQARIASQALMAPVVAFAKLSQTKADPFAGMSAADLGKIAIPAARAIPQIHEHERRLAAEPEMSEQAPPLQVIGAEFTWVQGRCTCGHAWDLHDQLVNVSAIGAGQMPCTSPGCACEHFIAEDDQI